MPGCHPVLKIPTASKRRWHWAASSNDVHPRAESLRADRLFIDEPAGRKRAQERGLAVRGTLGVLVEARKWGVHQQRCITVGGDEGQAVGYDPMG
jgi:hypothetical protein